MVVVINFIFVFLVRLSFTFTSLCLRLSLPFRLDYCIFLDVGILSRCHYTHTYTCIRAGQHFNFLVFLGTFFPSKLLPVAVNSLVRLCCMQHHVALHCSTGACSCNKIIITTKTTNNTASTLFENRFIGWVVIAVVISFYCFCFCYTALLNNSCWFSCFLVSLQYALSKSFSIPPRFSGSPPPPRHIYIPKRVY